ncbi:phosphotransferase family protein [Haloarchaeobius iranensis]|uniref:Predicted kinase, aminoglycoside phosphotransferase (APT) family n=1 Tax=Haloarchaeobius iranensis TaxID=996166 RepID=A0A1G9S8F6_9EURY|nr:phosphotransferase family protein [Haloarchaeobius iranensis]SDM31793.1 Predicted kinase, aminoglycoside phosphotransferase (APT) family [Haloarchaeobius iranensis]
MTDATRDTDALEALLAAELATEATGVETLSDGLNLVLAVATTDGEYVVRRPNKLRDRQYINPLRDEYRVMEHLHETALPTPEPTLYCDDETVLDGAFFVVPRVDGAVVPLGSDLPERFRHPEARCDLAHQLVDTLADVHALDTGAFAACCDRRTPREQVADGLRRLDAAAEVTGREFARLRAVGEWLVEHAPEATETTLVHGDYRPGNVLFAGDEVPEITGVIDWETALLGDPLVELGYLLLRWGDPDDRPVPLDGIAARYPEHGDAVAELRERNERGLAPFTTDTGSPSRRALVARYEEQTGREFDHERFYRANAAFSLASVWVDLHRHRVERGADSDLEPYIDHVTLLAERIVDGERPL